MLSVIFFLIDESGGKLYPMFCKNYIPVIATVIVNKKVVHVSFQASRRPATKLVIIK